MKIKCIIIDDDPTITDLVQYYCSKVPEIEYCISCNNSIDGLKLISQQEFDLVFLDYNMPDLNGKTILELKQDKSSVVMITSHSDFAVDSYNYGSVIDYLVKPVGFDRFYKAVEKFFQSRKDSPDIRSDKFQYVKDGNKWKKLDLEKVRFIKSDSNYVTWKTDEKDVVSLMNLKDLQSSLPTNFRRVHRSYIINVDFIDYFTAEEINIDNHMIPIGSKYKDVLKDILD